MSIALWWWVVVQVVAFCATPLCLALFRPLADRGYGLSKTFGLLVFGYITWLAAVSHVLPNSVVTLVLVLALTAGSSYLVWRREGEALKAFWRRRRGLLLLEEGIFLGTYLAFLLVRAHNADISGTEKFMDFAFLNGITRSTAFPPIDPWLAPVAALPHPTINYYYFGYLIQSLLVELSGVAPAEGFNLALSLLFGLAAIGIFSLVYGVSRDLLAEGARGRGSGLRVQGGGTAGALPGPEPRPLSPHRGARGVVSWSFKAAWPYVAAGATALYMLLFAGNLWTALRRFDNSGMWQKDFWAGVGWNATRVLVIKQGQTDVDYTINEFPAFSFLLGDLHPHVLTLPFALLAVALAYTWLMHPPRIFRWAILGERLLPEGGGAGSGLGARRSATEPRPAVRNAATYEDGADDYEEEQPASPLTWRERWERIEPFAELVPGALILGSLYFLNSWDFPAYFVLAQAAAIGGAWWIWKKRDALTLTPPPAARVPGSPTRGEGSRLWARGPSPRVGEGGRRPGEGEDDEEDDLDPQPSWTRGIMAVALVGAMAGLLLSPFIFSFKPPVVSENGSLPIGFWPHRSLLSQFFQFWGAQLLLLVPAVLAALSGVPFLRRSLSGSLSRVRVTAIVLRESAGWEPALLLAGGILVVLLAERVGFGVLVLCLLFAAGAGWAAQRALDPELNAGGRPLAFAFGAICLGALLLAACEVVYIRDFYGGALRRMNTVFKFYYQAWLLFSTGGSVATFWLLRRLHRRRQEPGGQVAFGAFAIVCALLFAATALFPYKVTLLRTNDFKNPATLDGMDWMRRYHPEDYAAAQWLREHGATPQNTLPVIAEATGGAYSEFARMATQTGFPTILGWDQHERLWRGASINGEVDQRKRDVDTIYTSATMAEAQPLLDKYNVAYIVVGYLEQAPDKYGQGGGLAKFDAATNGGGLQIAFRDGQTTIYKTPKAG